MHTALSLPEIVHAILLTLDNDVSTLHCVLFVNTLFSMEASRILWRSCGRGYLGSIPSHRVPAVTDLAIIRLRSRTRAEYYAGLIRELRISYDAERVSWIIPNEPPNKQIWDKTLYSLDFPALEAIRIQGNEHCQWINKTGFLSRVLNRNLKEIALSGYTVVSDGFLKTLARRSPGLKEFYADTKSYKTSHAFDTDDWIPDEDTDDETDEEGSATHDSNQKRHTGQTRKEIQNEYRRLLKADIGDGFTPLEDDIERVLSKEGLINFFDDMPTLRRFDIHSGFDDIWCREIFVALANHRNLEKMQIPDIESEWIHELKHGTGFQSLRELRIGLSVESLFALIDYIPPRIKTLRLDLSNQQTLRSSLAPISSLSNLIILSIDFPAATQLQSKDMLLVTKSCPNLRTFQLSNPRTNHRPLIEDITDSDVIEIAKHLPSLEDFCLIFQHTTPAALTEQSFIALCKQCKNLKLCQMTANVNFEMIASQDASIYARLRSVLLFIMPSENLARYSDPNTVGQRMQRIMPGVWNVWVEGGDHQVSEICVAFANQRFLQDF